MGREILLPHPSCQAHLMYLCTIYQQTWWNWVPVVDVPILLIHRIQLAIPFSSNSPLPYWGYQNITSKINYLHSDQVSGSVSRKPDLRRINYSHLNSFLHGFKIEIHIQQFLPKILGWFVFNVGQSKAWGWKRKRCKISDKHIFNTGFNELSEIVFQREKESQAKAISEHAQSSSLHA